MKRSQTKIHFDIMSGSKVIKSEKSKFIIRSNLFVGQNILPHSFLFLCRF